MINVGGKMFELVQEHKDGWKPDAFKERYSEVLDRYDYIVGDWGYNQLRLKGFFKEGSNKAAKDSAIGTLQDYLQEYCNFGCAYFILRRVSGKGASEGTSPEETAASDSDAAAAVVDEPRAAVMGFSDRRPYSWREHQSPSRLSGRKNETAEENKPDGDSDKPDNGAGGGARRDGRGGGQDSRRGEYSRSSGGKPQRHHSQGRNDDNRGGQPREGGGRKFQKGPRSGGGKGRGGRQDGGEGASRGGSRPDSQAARGRAPHHSQQAEQDGAERERTPQRHHHKPQQNQ